MPNLEAIGSTHLTSPLRADDTPVVRAKEPEREQPVEKAERADKGGRAEKRLQVERVELPTRAFSARLNYDQESEEVIVEILDPETGDVLQRFPAEELPEDVRALLSNAGSLVETFA